jgi:ABC-type multidrug transport system ATPase subunit
MSARETRGSFHRAISFFRSRRRPLTKADSRDTLELVGLGDRARPARIRGFSAAERQRLGIAQARSIIPTC